MPATAKLELLLTLKDKLKGGYATAKASLKGHVNDLKGQVSGLQTRFVQGFRAMRDQIPGLGTALNLLKNPLAIAAVGVTLLTTTMIKGVKAAGEYNNQFLELRNLNLDKTNAQLAAYDKRILNLALREGFDSKKTAQGFYDVQSALGIYGNEVETFITKIGRFSKATKADYNDSLNSATKAMKAFGFGVNRLDEFLASNAKTVQVGITTFNELAQVQTEYGGAAAAAGANFNTANKVFAAFTSIAKDSAMAATMTKAAFTGLTKKRTIEGMHSIGIEMFNAKGEMRDLDQVMREMVPAIDQLSDREFLKLRNQIRGPEGLQNLLNKMRTSGDDLIKTFDAFDASAFDTSKALKNAHNDYKVLREEMANRFNNVMIRLGNSIMPSVISGLKSLSGVFDLFKSRTEIATERLESQRESYNKLKSDIVPLLDRYDQMKAKSILTVSEQSELKKVINQISDAIPGAATYIDQYGNAMDIAAGKARSFVTQSKDALKIVNEQAIKAQRNQLEDYRKEIASLQLQLGSGNRLAGGSGNQYLPIDDQARIEMQSRIRGLNELMKQARRDLRDLTGDKQIFTGGPLGPLAGLTHPFVRASKGGKPNKTTEDLITDQTDGLKVVGDVKQVKNITLNIQALHQGDNVVHTDSQQGMTEQDLEQWYEERILRAIRNVEASA